MAAIDISFAVLGVANNIISVDVPQFNFISRVLCQMQLVYLSEIIEYKLYDIFGL
jgi:hypothetical protein